MSTPSVAHATAPDIPNPPRRPHLERGTFSDGVQVFSVRASSERAPDSFQVYACDRVGEIVLVISGLAGGDLKATWGRNWVSAAEEYREWFEAQSFMAFYNGDLPSCHG